MNAKDGKDKGFMAVRFKDGKLIEVCGYTLEMATYEGSCELRVPKIAGAKVTTGRKHLTKPPAID